MLLLLFSPPSISMKLIFLLLTLEIHHSHLVSKLLSLGVSAVPYFSSLTTKFNICTFLVPCSLKRHRYYLA